MPDILSTCKRLGSFCFFECEAGVRSVLHVEDARLLGLVISYGELKILELNCLPKLQQMTYNNWSCYGNPLVLGFIPQLPKLCLANEHPPINILELSQLLPNVPLIWIRPECTEALAPVFTKLRCVNLDNLSQERDLAWTVFLLKAAPFVEELCIILRDHECQRESELKWEPADPDFKHNNLARLTIYGFQSDDSFMGYVRRVIQATLNIKEICLHGSEVCKLSAEKIPQVDVHPLSYPRTSEEGDSLRKMVTEVEAKEDSLRNVSSSWTPELILVAIACVVVFLLNRILIDYIV